jgi:hypothetical protein
MARPQLPESLVSLTEDLTVPALGDADLSRLASLADASPEDFQKACALAFRKLVVAGFQTLQAPRNWKEQATTLDLWRKLEGMDAKDKGGLVPVGMVGVLRSVSRRPVLDAEAVEEEPAFE